MADWGGIIAGALGGGAGAVQGMAQGYIEDERRADTAKLLADVDEQKQKRVAQAQQDMAFAAQEKERQRVAGYMQGGGGFTAARDRAAAAGALGDAATFDKMNESGYTNVAPFASVWDKNTKTEVYRNDGHEKAAAGRKGKFDDLPDGTKLQYQSINRQGAAIEAALLKMKGDPMYKPGSEGEIDLLKQQDQNTLTKLRFEAAHGLADGRQNALDMLDIERDPAKIRINVEQAFKAGHKYGAAYAAAVNEAGVPGLEKVTEGSAGAKAGSKTDTGKKVEGKKPDNSSDQPYNAAGALNEWLNAPPAAQPLPPGYDWLQPWRDAAAKGDPRAKAFLASHEAAPPPPPPPPAKKGLRDPISPDDISVISKYLK